MPGPSMPQLGSCDTMALSLGLFVLEEVLFCSYCPSAQSRTDFLSTSILAFKHPFCPREPTLLHLFYNVD